MSKAAKRALNSGRDDVGSTQLAIAPLAGAGVAKTPPRDRLHGLSKITIKHYHCLALLSSSTFHSFVQLFMSYIIEAVSGFHENTLEPLCWRMRLCVSSGYTFARYQSPFVSLFTSVIPFFFLSFCLSFFQFRISIRDRNIFQAE